MVEFDLQEGDLVRARVWAFFAQRAVRFVYYVFIVAFVFAPPWLVEGGVSPPDLGKLLIMPILFVATPLAVIFGSRSLYKNLKPAQRHVRYVFAEEGFESTTDFATGTVSWEAIQRAVETKQAFYLFFQKSMFHVVPSRGFASHSDIEKFRKLLRDKLGGRAKVQ